MRLEGVFVKQDELIGALVDVKLFHGNSFDLLRVRLTLPLGEGSRGKIPPRCLQLSLSLVPAFQFRIERRV